MFGKPKINDPYNTMGAAPAKSTRPKSPKLSNADKLTANAIAWMVKQYGPLTKEQVAALAKNPPVHALSTPGMRERERDLLAYGLTNLASEMEPGEKATGTSIPRWKR